MIYEEETALIRRGLFDVQNGVGLGRHEEIYHKALAMWLETQGIPFVSKHPHSLMLNGDTAHVLYPDFVVWNKITVELKAFPHRLQSSEHVQLFNYLKCRNDKLGLLVNMGLDRVHVKRIIYETRNCPCIEDWTCWNGQISGTDRDVALQVRDVLRNIVDSHKTGYGTEITERLIRLGLKQNRLNFVLSPVGESVFQGRELGKTPFDCLLIENRILLVFTALFDDNQFNFHRGLSFMNVLNVPWGIAVNFGKESIRLQGLATSNNIRGSGIPSVGLSDHPIRGSGIPSVGLSDHPIRGSGIPSVGLSDHPIRGSGIPSVGLSDHPIRGSGIPSVGLSDHPIRGSGIPSVGLSDHPIRGSGIPSEGHK